MVAPVFISGRTTHRALKTIPLFSNYQSEIYSLTSIYDTKLSGAEYLIGKYLVMLTNVVLLLRRLGLQNVVVAILRT